MREFAKEQSHFDFPGHVFTYLELLLEDQGVELYKFEKSPASDQFRSGRNEHGSIFDAPGAKRTSEMLGASQLSVNALENFMKEDYPEEDLVEGVEAIGAAATTMAKWLDTVKEGEIGLFIF
ncbi:MAG: hypothetical protein AAGL96_18120 [Pseudomonadota bacterium]